MAFVPILVAPMVVFLPVVKEDTPPSTQGCSGDLFRRSRVVGPLVALFCHLRRWCSWPRSSRSAPEHLPS